MAAPVTLAAFGRTQGAIWPVVVACAAAAVLIRLPDLELFEIGPLKARLRRAEADLNQLQQLAAALSGPILGLVAANGRFAGPGRRRAMENRDGIVQHLRRMELPASEIEKITAVFDRYIHIDLAHDLKQAVDTELYGKPVADIAFACTSNIVRADLTVGEASTVRTCLVEAVGTIPTDIEQALADLEHYEAHKTLRRREVFLDRR